MSVLWYWGSKRKVMALDSQKVLLADLFRVKHPADEDDGYAAASPPVFTSCVCMCMCICVQTVRKPHNPDGVAVTHACS